MMANKCKKCGGDGKNLVPIKNIARLPLAVQDWDFKLNKALSRKIIPDYFTVIHDCDCVQKEK